MKKEIGDLTLNEIIELCSKMSACKIKDGKNCPLYDTDFDCSIMNEVSEIVLNQEIEVDENVKED